MVSDFNSKISELEAEKSIREKTNINDIIKAIFDQPKILIIVMFWYMVLISMMLFYFRRKRRRREIEREVYEEYQKDREDVLYRELPRKKIVVEKVKKNTNE